MADQDAANASETPETVELTLRVLGEDGAPDNELTADLAKFLAESGYNVTLTSSDEASSVQEADTTD